MSFGILWLDISLFALLGLLIGSFLNVVIARLPKMMERQWAEEAAHAAGNTPPEAAPFNLVVPRSRCPHCQHPITWYENIPVLSFLALGGRCSACKAPISMRYPAVELATAVLFGLSVYIHGANAGAVAWCFFSAVLLSLALIDWDTTLLPDDLTLPLLWGGLIAANMHWSHPLSVQSAVWGAVAGYMSLWLIYWAFKLVTGKEGMGYGDFKLYAALGAWFGPEALIPIILIASVFGAVVGIVLKLNAGLREGGYIPFGPFLAFAGFAAMLFGGPQLRQLVGL